MGLILVGYFASHVMCRKLVSYKSAGNFLTKCFLGTNLNATVSILNKCRKFSYKMPENFLHTSVKCCTSAGKFPAHTVKIWIFSSSAGNMIPTLQPPNTGALSHGLSFLISFGTCCMLFKQLLQPCYVLITQYFVLWRSLPSSFPGPRQHFVSGKYCMKPGNEARNL